MSLVATSASEWKPPAAKSVSEWLLRFLLFTSFVTLTPLVSSAASTPDIAILVGAPGEPDYAEGFSTAARAWEKAAERAGASTTVIGLDQTASTDDRAHLQQWLASHLDSAPSASDSAAPLWIVYLGHGTHDGRETRLNLRGADLTAKDLATWLAPLRRPLVFIHGGSAAAPFINALSGPNRIIITATRSGHELNYARFGERFADAVANPTADIDQDGQTSLLEAFVTAAQQVQAFYAETGRLATEHALIDDNGDQQGTPAEWFRGTRLERRPQTSSAKPDGNAARLLALIPTETERNLTPEQRSERDRLESELENLRAKKSSLPEADYYRELEALFRRLGAIYRQDS